MPPFFACPAKMSQNPWGSARPSAPPPGPLPWFCRYREDPASAERYEQPSHLVHRPIADASLCAKYPMDAPVWALIDSGCEHVLAAPGLARAVGIDLGGATRETVLGIGGDSVRFKFVDVIVRLHPPGASVDQYLEWDTEVGFGGQWKAPWSMLLGQSGFFDMFSVSMQRHVGLTVIDRPQAMDDIYGVRYLGWD
jgi:hypothetical protein